MKLLKINLQKHSHGRDLYMFKFFDNDSIEKGRLSSQESERVVFSIRS